MNRRTAWCMAAAFLLASASASAQVELRSRERLDGAITKMTIAGVRMAPAAAGAPERLLSWDRIKSAPADGASAFAPLADKLWRARTRVERGDFAGAEPLLDELAPMLAAEQGPSAAVVAECQARCRLARGAQGAATTSWIWWTALSQGRHGGPNGDRKDERPEWIGGSADLPPLVDVGTGLSPLLPPIWMPLESTAAAARTPEWSRLRSGTGVAGELAAIYHESARFEAGLTQEVVLDEVPGASPGVSLAREIVLARAGDEEERAAARATLQRRIELFTARPDAGRTRVPPPPRWVEAWCRIGLGRSLIRETDTSLRMRGVIELLHLPARFGSDQPFLAGLALADAANTMADVGDMGAAEALKADLMTKFPSHPMVRWERLNRIGKSTGAPSPSPGA